jgi:hypothetical protein
MGMEIQPSLAHDFSKSDKQLMYSDFKAAMVFGFDFEFLTVWSYKICQKLKIEAKIHSGYEIRIH